MHLGRWRTLRLGRSDSSSLRLGPRPYIMIDHRIEITEIAGTYNALCLSKHIKEVHSSETQISESLHPAAPEPLENVPGWHRAHCPTPVDPAGPENHQGLVRIIRARFRRFLQERMQLSGKACIASTQIRWILHSQGIILS
jgi:hypothetical protein